MGLVEQHHALNRPEHPTCSICIANYNGARLLDDCLASLLAQEGGISIEIIVHDDASTDGSVALLRERYPGVELLVSAENVGFCVSNNRMVALARGEFVLLLNNDAALHPDALVSLLAASRKQSPSGILTLPQYDWESGVLVDRGCQLDLFYNPVPNLDADRFAVAMVIAACLWLERKVWNELGGFPEWIESIGEDMYLCCIARLQGRPVQVINASSYRHRQGASFGGNRVDGGRLQTTFRRRRLSERNKTAVMVISTPTVLVWPLLMVHVLGLVLEGGLLALFKRDDRVWKEIYRPTLGFIATNLRQLQALRRQVQRVRRASLREYMRGVVFFPRKLSLLLRYGVPTLK